MLKTKIQEDIIAAMKVQDKEKLEVLRYLMAQIKNAEIEKGKKELNEQEITQLLSNQIKKLKESWELFKKGQRQDLMSKTENELKTLSAYLPQQMTEAELSEAVDKLMAENHQLKEPGPLIGFCVRALAGKADNAQIAKLVHQKLA